jgi:hypothetical protein
VSVALLVLAATLLAPAACKKSEAPWVELYKRSARSDIDLYLVPKKYALLESSWMKKTAIARFNKEAARRRACEIWPLSGRSAEKARIRI